jgi:hypothetical protein
MTTFSCRLSMTFFRRRAATRGSASTETTCPAGRSDATCNVIAPTFAPTSRKTPSTGRYRRTVERVSGSYIPYANSLMAIGSCKLGTVTRFPNRSAMTADFTRLNRITATRARRAFPGVRSGINRSSLLVAASAQANLFRRSNLAGSTQNRPLHT